MKYNLLKLKNFLLTNNLKKEAMVIKKISEDLGDQVDLSPLFEPQEESGPHAKFFDPISAVIGVIVGKFAIFIGDKITEAIMEKVYSEGLKAGLKFLEKKLFEYFFDNREINLDEYFIKNSFLERVKNVQISEESYSKLDQSNKIEEFKEIVYSKIGESEESFMININNLISEVLLEEE